MTTTYTFVNQAAAVAFRDEFWEMYPYSAVAIVDSRATLELGGTITRQEFLRRAEAFNATAQKALEVSQEEK